MSQLVGSLYTALNGSNNNLARRLRMTFVPNQYSKKMFLIATSLSTVVLNSRDRQGMYGMQHFRAPINKPHNSL